LKSPTHLTTSLLLEDTIMPLLILVMNIIWFVLGGFIAGLAWILAGIIMAITIVGLPWARSCFMLARFSFWPFGYDIASRDKLYGRGDMGTGTLGTIGNVIWFVLAGWWLAVMHISAAIALAVTIIGIPFAWQHVKLAIASLFPIGKSVVSADRLWPSKQDLPRLQHPLQKA
jgi:uncharacterized membrane protein YccF (DUF307 family)